MQAFTFHRKADRLRGDVRIWQVAASAEAGVMIALGIALLLMGERRAGTYVLLFTPFYFAFVWWLYSRPLRRKHMLTDETLTLVEKGGRSWAIPRSEIQSAQRYAEPLPRGLAPVTYKYIPEEDTLFILPDKQNLVAITLRRPVRAKLTHRIVVEFTRVVCMVDEPDAFIAALLPGALPPAEDHVRTQQESATVLLSPTRCPGQVAIALSSLTKRFGTFTAVEQLNLQVAPGEVFAFLGSNGAGKSTTIKMLVGLLRPTSGQVLIQGQDPWQDLNARRLLGYVPDSPMLYENLTAQEHLWLIGGLYDLPEPEARARALELLQQVGLAEQANQPIRSFSLGMKRKLSIASALVHRPPILILDEATNGLDPRAAREVKDFIRAEARAGTTILLTTHLLDVVGELATRIAIIDQGALQACGTLPELQTLFARPEASLEELFLLATDRARREASA